jgi:protein-disulfide isomerase
MKSVLVLTVSFMLGGAVLTIAAETPLAEVNGETITAAEVERAITPQISKLEEQIYTLKRQRLEALVRDRLLAQEAKRRGISTPALLDREVTAKVSLVTEEEIEASYQAGKARFAGDEERAREQIRTTLQGQKLAAKREEFVKALRARAHIVVMLQAPPVVRAEVGVEGAATKGAAKAPVTIVEFSDFLCPFCKRAQATLAAIETRYGDQVRFVFRDYPIEELHPGATKAAEAARCANEQDKFWPYHDIIFQKVPRTPEELKLYAAEVGLDVTKFDACLTSGTHAAAVQKDIQEGARLGIDGTPAFFINGRVVKGAQPVEAFAQIIDDELSRRQ